MHLTSRPNSKCILQRSGIRFNLRIISCIEPGWIDNFSYHSYMVHLICSQLKLNKLSLGYAICIMVSSHHIDAGEQLRGYHLGYAICIMVSLHHIDAGEQLRGYQKKDLMTENGADYKHVL